MAHKGATRAVIRNLSIETGIWACAGDRFAVQSFDLFVPNAKSWLGDRSNLKSSTLDSADWAEVYAYFKEGN